MIFSTILHILGFFFFLFLFVSILVVVVILFVLYRMRRLFQKVTTEVPKKKSLPKNEIIVEVEER